MKTQLIALMIVLIPIFYLNAPVMADVVSVDIAEGVQFSDGDALFISYKPARLEYNVGMWDGDDHNTTAGVGYPLETQGKVRFTWTPGFALLSRRTDILGTHWQFYNQFRVRYAEGQRLSFDFGWFHYSNGSRVLNHGHVPNRGENFLTLSFKYAFGEEG